MTIWLDVIGLGEEGIETLSAPLQEKIANAELIVGGERHLAMLPQVHAQKISWATPLSDTIDEILRHRGQKVVVLATGDPMHFGIGVSLVRHVDLSEMAIHPSVSAFSLAAARLGWPLAEVECLTLHGRPLETLLGVVAPQRRLLILSHDGSTPASIAEKLVELGYGESKLTILEHMGGSKETIHRALAKEWKGKKSKDLNTIAIECRADKEEKSYPLGFGIEDERFKHDGKITKREIRAATLSLLAPRPGELLWDVGSGSGSIAIEWLRQHSSMQAIAIENNPERMAAIRRNAANFGVPRLRLVEVKAPEAFRDLAEPDAIFIGGGLSDPKLIDSAWERLKKGGVIVANAVTTGGEMTLLAAEERWGGSLTRLSVARLAEIGAHSAWKPLMPVTQWSQRKK